ncbi:MarR family winged helix-turn-helix transcriptional regulator [Ciceribacter azotifigens]|uniref:MarR family winged helix-turn-helix transcriptional regulator n=1 Tax=Ciceribacter azotifigens TaxID=2069303 RepID=UPI003A84B7BF
MVLVDRLEACQLLERRTSDVDRRRKDLFLTAQGQAILQEARDLIAAQERRLTSRFSGAELDAFIERLKRSYQSDEEPRGNNGSAGAARAAEAH